MYIGMYIQEGWLKTYWHVYTRKLVIYILTCIFKMISYIHPCMYIQEG